MVLGQVGKRRRAELESPDPLLRQSVRGNFHGRSLAAVLTVLGEISKQVQGFGRSVTGGEDFARKTVLNRAEEGTIETRSRANGFEQVSRGGLAVRAGDTDEL